MGSGNSTIWFRLHPTNKCRKNWMKKFQNGLLVGRVLLFCVSCAVVLATVAPLRPRGSGPNSMLYIGAMACIGTFFLKLLFVRWEGLRFGHIRACQGRGSPLRLAFGFIVGLFLSGYTH